MLKGATPVITFAVAVLLIACTLIVLMFAGLKILLGPIFIGQSKKPNYVRKGPRGYFIPRVQ